MSDRAWWDPSVITSMGPRRHSGWIRLRVCIVLPRWPDDPGMCASTGSTPDILLYQQGRRGCQENRWSSSYQTGWHATTPCSILERRSLGHRCCSRILWPERRWFASLGVWWEPDATTFVGALRKIHQTCPWRAPHSSLVRCSRGEHCLGICAKLSLKLSERNPRWNPFLEWAPLDVFVRPSWFSQMDSCFSILHNWSNWQECFLHDLSLPSKPLDPFPFHWVDNSQHWSEHFPVKFMRFGEHWCLLYRPPPPWSTSYLPLGI